MRISRLLVVFYVSFILSGCSSISAPPSNHPVEQSTAKTAPPTTSKHQTKKKDPMTVSFYRKGENPNAPYVVIGEAKVSKYNRGGIKRQDAMIHDAMRTVAASMGGDAIIDIKRTPQSVVGKVIVYQSKIMV